MNRRTSAQSIGEVMAALAAGDGEEPRLPDPRLIARRARLLARIAEEDSRAARAARPVWIAVVAGPVLATTLLSVRAASGSTAALVLVLGLLAVTAALPMILVSE